MDAVIKKVLDTVQPLLAASLDALCVVDASNKIVFSNLSMKNFLGLTGQSLRKEPCFCEILKLAACEKSCQIQEILHSGETLRLDEAPASRGALKIRVLLKAVPLFDPASPAGKERVPVGAILTLRDTTGEVLLQAKYHKLMQILAERDVKIGALESRINQLQSTLKRGRGNANAA